MTTKVIFAGTPDFAATALHAIAAAGFEIVLVLTQPDRAKGRGMKLQASPVKQAAQALGLPLAQPVSLRNADAAALLAAQQADVMVVAAYGLLLPAEILAIPRRGCLNIHASLLPRWRGAAPIQRAIAAGDAETGVCIMQMDEGLDTGAIVSTHRYAIQPADTAQSVHNALAQIGAHAIVADLQQLDSLQPTPQPQHGISYAHKLSKAEAQIDWTQPARVIERQIRAFNPAPGAWTVWQQQPLKIWQAAVVADKHGAPGTVLPGETGQWLVACGEQTLSLQQVQAAGGKAMPVSAFLAGKPIAAGSVLAQPETSA